MKKIIIVFTVILIAFGIAFYFYKSKDFNKNQKDTEPKINNTENSNKEKVPEYVDNNPITVGLYKRNNTTRNLVKEYTDNWHYHQDISSFEVYYTNEETLNGNQKSLFDQYKDTYNNINDYKIGYIINFRTKEKTINKVIVSPKDGEEFYDYLEVYLYDDYNRTPGVWYSHTTEEEFNSETILTSIKLTAGKNIQDIVSDISLSAFTYDNDDFDEQGNYRGVSKYTITVKNKDN